MRIAQTMAFLAVWVGLSGFVRAEATRGKGGGDPPAVWLYAEGLSCPLCAHNLEAQLKRVAGVARVQIDLGAGRAGVWFVPGKQPTSAQLERAVRNSGFTFIREERP